MSNLATTTEIDTLIAADAPVALGVSGGKDSCALAFAATEHLNRVGHNGPRILINADLGRVEWPDSIPTCERLAKAVGLELAIVRRKAGDMMDRWLSRWENNVERYRTLSCVKLILPWSTPAMRFCTSESKQEPICSDLVRRFPNSRILSANGIRRDESTQRKKAPVTKEVEKLKSKKYQTTGLAWQPLVDWSLEDVLGICRRHDFRMHEAYQKYGSSRVSCCYCIYSTPADLRAAAGCEDNVDIYREMVHLEIRSTYAFQGNHWLGDAAPHLLGPVALKRLVAAKEKAAERERIEAAIPDDLLYVKGWPVAVPTRSEARLLASVRRKMAKLMGFNQVLCLNEVDVIGRYEELMAVKAAKEAA